MAPGIAMGEAHNYGKRTKAEDHLSDIIPPRIPVRTSSKPVLRIPIRKSSLPLCKASARLQQPTTPTAQLLKLPPEIIQQIASLLPHTTAAIFTFTCTTIRSILGTQYWDAFNDDLRAREHLIRVWLSLPPTKPLPSKPHTISQVPKRCIFNHITLETHTHQQCTLLPRGSSLESLQAFQMKLKPRRRLLELLVRDTPELIRCGRCVILHRPGRKHPAIHQSDLRECEAADKRMGVDQIIYAGFTFPHAQYAMKLSRSGGDPDAYLKSLARRTRRKDVSFRICNGEFYMRARYFIPLSLPSKKTSSANTDIPPLLVIRPSQSHICTHLSINNALKNNNLVPSHYSHNHEQSQKSKDKSLSLDSYIQSILISNSASSSTSTKEKEIQQCMYCETEFRFSIEKNAGGGKMQMGVLTKWMCFGTATTCGDEKWIRHFDIEKDGLGSPSASSSSSSSETRNGNADLGVDGDGNGGRERRTRWKRGEIRRGFEEAGGKRVV